MIAREGKARNTMSQLTKTIIAIAIATSLAGSAYAASRAQAVRGAMMTGDGWTNAQPYTYDDPAPGDQAKGNIH
jgi:hypothetical protein